MCMYKSNRKINNHLVIPVQDGADNDNTYVMRSLPVVQLQFELSERGLSTTGLKPVLLAHIVHAIMRKNKESECDEKGGSAVDSKDHDIEDEIACGTV